MINLPIESTTGAFAINPEGHFLVESSNEILTFDRQGKRVKREKAGIPEGFQLTGIRPRKSGVLEKTFQRYYEFPEGKPDEPCFIEHDGKPKRFNPKLPTAWQNQGTVRTPAGVCAFGPGYLPRAPDRDGSWGPSLCTRTKCLFAYPEHDNPKWARCHRPLGATGPLVADDWVAPHPRRWTALDTITGCAYFKKQLWFVVHLGMGYCRYEPGGLVADRMEHWLLRLSWDSWRPSWEQLDFEARNIAVWQGEPWFLEAYWEDGLKYRVRELTK